MHQYAAIKYRHLSKYGQISCKLATNIAQFSLNFSQSQVILYSNRDSSLVRTTGTCTGMAISSLHVCPKWQIWKYKIPIGAVAPQRQTAVARRLQERIECLHWWRWWSFRTFAMNWTSVNLTFISFLKLLWAKKKITKRIFNLAGSASNATVTSVTEQCWILQQRNCANTMAILHCKNTASRTLRHTQDQVKQLAVLILIWFTKSWGHYFCNVVEQQLC